MIQIVSITEILYKLLHFVKYYCESKVTNSQGLGLSEVMLIFLLNATICIDDRRNLGYILYHIDISILMFSLHEWIFLER